MEENLTKVQIKERNEKFIKLQDEWKKDHDSKKWNEMWTIAYDCLYNTLKKKAGGKRNDLEELAMDGTIVLMDRLKNGAWRFHRFIRKNNNEEWQEVNNPKTPKEYKRLGFQVKGSKEWNNDYRVEYLPTCMHFISLKLLYNPQQQFDDKLESLEEYEERNEWDNKE